MKTIIILILLFIPLQIYSQKALYCSFQPADLGIGLRADIGIFYTSFSYGNWGIYRQNNLKHHLKFTAGIMVPLKSDKEGYKFRPTAGINFHYIGEAGTDNIKLDSKIFNLLSFEIGNTVYFRKFAISAMTDILRWEPTIYLGINF